MSQQQSSQQLHDQVAHTTGEPFDDLPPRRQVGRSHTLQLLLAGMGGGIVIAVIIFFSLQWYLRPGATLTGTQGSQQTTQQGVSVSSAPCDKFTQPEFVVERQTLAQELHLSVEQVGAKLQAGFDIASIAAQQGVTPDQLYQMELTAHQTMLTQMVHDGRITQQDADHYMDVERTASRSELNSTARFMFVCAGQS